MKKMKRFAPILIVVLLLAAAGVAAALGLFKSDSAVAVSLGRVETVDIEQTVVASGRLQAAAVESIPVAATARVQSVSAAEGDIVRKGDVLAELDVENLTLQRQKLLLAAEDLNAQLQEIEQPTLKGGSTGVRTRITQLELTVADTERRLTLARTQLEKDRKLYNDGVGSRQTLDASQAAVDALVNTLDQNRQALASARVEAADLGANQSLQAQSLLRRIEQNKADLALVDWQIEQAHVTAGIDGTVLDMPLKAGQYPPVGSVIRLHDTTRLEAVVWLSQEDATRVESGQTATVSVKGQRESYEAKVTALAGEAAIEPGSGSSTPKVKVTLALSGSDGLKAGFEADVAITAGKAAAQNAVLREAITRDAQGSPIVLTVVPDAGSGTDGSLSGTVRIVPVTPQLDDGVRVAIGEAIDTGTAVILAPDAALAEGSRVKGAVAP